MDKGHLLRVQCLQVFLNKIGARFDRVLDVSGGDGKVCRDLFLRESSH